VRSACHHEIHRRGNERAWRVQDRAAWNRFCALKKTHTVEIVMNVADESYEPINIVRLLADGCAADGQNNETNPV
jgi:hypothetical protein